MMLRRLPLALILLGLAWLAVGSYAVTAELRAIREEPDPVRRDAGQRAVHGLLWPLTFGVAPGVVLVMVGAGLWGRPTGG